MQHQQSQWRAKTQPHSVMSVLRIISLSDLQILIQFKLSSSPHVLPQICISCIIDCEFTAVFPAVSSPAQCINPSAAAEEEAMTQEGAITLLSVKSAAAKWDFLQFM